MEIKFYVTMIVSLLVVVVISIYAARNKKKPICKYDGYDLANNGAGALYCPKCGKMFYEVDGQLNEKP